MVEYQQGLPSLFGHTWSVHTHAKTVPGVFLHDIECVCACLSLLVARKMLCVLAKSCLGSLRSVDRFPDGPSIFRFCMQYMHLRNSRNFRLSSNSCGVLISHFSQSRARYLRSIDSRPIWLGVSDLVWNVTETRFSPLVITLGSYSRTLNVPLLWGGRLSPV